MILSSIWNEVEHTARASGALDVGAGDLADPNAPLFDDWIERGHHATMHYLAKNRAARLDPQRRFPWAKSAIVILVPYASERPHAPENALSHHIARYALGD